MLKIYFNLSKVRITILVIITTILGYMISYKDSFVLSQFLYLILGVYLVSSGSFILNQAHESKLDKKMDRTKLRPIPSGKISVFFANVLGFIWIFVGLGVLSLIHFLPVFLSLITCLLYNFYYTIKWKKNFPFAAVVLGAIPGAMPVVIGYSVGMGSIFSIECFYLFLIMFLWQMPHFWSLAFHYRNDYKKGGIPILPVSLGEERTFFHIGLYMFAYLGVALLSPFFLKTSLPYLIIVFPLCVKIIVEFYFFYKKRRWLAFFSWLNLSLLIFLGMPFIDKWAWSLLFL